MPCLMRSLPPPEMTMMASAKTGLDEGERNGPREKKPRMRRMKKTRVFLSLCDGFFFLKNFMKE